MYEQFKDENADGKFPFSQEQITNRMSAIRKLAAERMTGKAATQPKLVVVGNIICRKLKVATTEKVLQLAQSGDAEAALHVGQQSRQNEEYAAAATWFGVAADQGNASEKNELGEMHRHGEGTDVDHNVALSFFREAAAAGSSKATFNIGCMYEEGEGVDKVVVRALQMFLAASGGHTWIHTEKGWDNSFHGEPDAMFNVAVGW